MKKSFIYLVAGLLFTRLSYASDLGDFKPYIFKENGSCATPAALNFEYLQGKMLQSVGLDSQNRKILFNANVSFNEKNEFRAYTEEYVWTGTAKEILKTEQITGKAEIVPVTGITQLNLTDSKGKFWAALVLTEMNVDPYGRFILLGVADRLNDAGEPLGIGLFQDKSTLGPYQEDVTQYCKSPF